jgi:broad specificity phosphatase PhoE
MRALGGRVPWKKSTQTDANTCQDLSTQTNSNNPANAPTSSSPSNVLFYTSDLTRAVDSAHCLDPDAPWQSDERLREVAKGAREGYPKTWSLEECEKVVQEANEFDNINTDVIKPASSVIYKSGTYSKLETSEQGWERVKDWCESVVKDVYKSTIENYQMNDSQSAMTSVVAVVHSGLLRILLTRLLGSEALYNHPSAQVEDCTMKSSKGKEYRVNLKNASLTILDATISTDASSDDIDKWHITEPSQEESPLVRFDVVKLADTTHYADIVLDAHEQKQE